MRNIYSYNNFLNESISISEENKQTIDDIVSIFQDIIDDGYNVKFNSVGGSMTFEDYVSKREHKFNPICFFTHNNKKAYDFSVVIQIKSYNDIIKIVDESQTFVPRLKDEGWEMTDFKTYNDTRYRNAVFETISYTFKKPDVFVEGETKLPDINFVDKIISNYDIYVDDIDIYDEFIEIRYSAVDRNEEQGLGSNELESIFNNMCDDLGCHSWSPGKDRWTINFHYE